MPRTVKINRYTLDNEYIDTYNSIAEAANAMKVNESSIRRALGGARICCGSKWFEAETSDIEANVNESTSDISEFRKHLEKVGIKEEDVKSVKFWQTQSGELRYSIVKNFEEDMDDTFFEELTKTLTTVLQPVHWDNTKPTEDRALVIHTADKHIGADTTTQSMYNNEYNAEVVKSRMLQIIDTIYEEYQTYDRFDTIVFNDLGDPLDGYNGFTTRKKHKLPQNMTDREAFDVYVETHKEFFDRLVSMNAANNIVFNAVTEDNHSGAFGYCANRAVEIYLNAKYPQIQTRMMHKFVEHFEYGKHVYMLSHGKDSEDLQGGFPLQLNNKTENYIKDYIDHHSLTGYLHFVKGDLHQNSVQYTRKFRYKNVMSLYGASKWIQNNFGNTRGGVCYDIIEKNAPKVLEGFIMF